MKLSKLAILAIKGACPGIIPILAKAINVSEPSVYKYISENNDNLTKAAALVVIKETTGLAEEDILETEEAINATK